MTNKKYSKVVKHNKKILAYLKEYPKGRSAKEVSKRLEVTRDHAYKLLQDLSREGAVESFKEQRGPGRAQNIYRLPQTDGFSVEGRHTSEYETELKGDPLISGSSCVGDVDENKNTNQKSYNEDRSPGYPDLAETITNTNNNNSWGELRNRLIDAAQKSIPTKQPGLIEALYVMMTMEKEIIEDGGVV